MRCCAPACARSLLPATYCPWRTSRSSQIVDESFEYAHNATTGLSHQWAIGGAGAGFGTTHELLSQPLAALNGLQYLGLTASATAPAVWAQSGGLNMQGLSFEPGC